MRGDGRELWVEVCEGVVCAVCVEMCLQCVWRCVRGGVWVVYVEVCVVCVVCLKVYEWWSF